MALGGDPGRSRTRCCAIRRTAQRSPASSSCARRAKKPTASSARRPHYRKPHCRRAAARRLSVRRGKTPPAGAYVEVKAQLNPPLQPLRPRSYHFARDLYFQRLALGLRSRRHRNCRTAAEAGRRLRANAFVQGLRDNIDFRIRSGSPATSAPFRRAHHRKARRDLGASLRFDVCVRHRPRVSISGYHVDNLLEQLSGSIRSLRLLAKSAHSRRSFRPTSLQNAISNCIGATAKRPVASITESDVQEQLRQIIDKHGKTAAIRVKSNLSAFYVWALKEGIAKINQQ